MELDRNIVEKALSITGKKYHQMVDKENNGSHNEVFIEEVFSMERFCYYLLSPEFIANYVINIYNYGTDKYPQKSNVFASEFGEAIHNFQNGKIVQLEHLLSNIN